MKWRQPDLLLIKDDSGFPVTATSLAAGPEAGDPKAMVDRKPLPPG